MVNNQSIVAHALNKRMATSLSVDEILLSRCELVYSFIGLLLKVEMTPFHLKLMNSVLFSFTWRPMSLAACSRLCSRDSAKAGVFVRSAK